jgi:hypothetical protein
VRARTSAGTHLQGSGVGTDGAGALRGAVGQPLAVPLALVAGRVGNRLRGAIAPPARRAPAPLGRSRWPAPRRGRPSDRASRPRRVSPGRPCPRGSRRPPPRPQGRAGPPARRRLIARISAVGLSVGTHARRRPVAARPSAAPPASRGRGLVALGAGRLDEARCHEPGDAAEHHDRQRLAAAEVLEVSRDAIPRGRHANQSPHGWHWSMRGVPQFVALKAAVLPPRPVRSGRWHMRIESARTGAPSAMRTDQPWRSAAKPTASRLPASVQGRRSEARWPAGSRRPAGRGEGPGGGGRQAPCTSPLGCGHALVSSRSAAFRTPARSLCARS